VNIPYYFFAFLLLNCTGAPNNRTVLEVEPQIVAVEAADSLDSTISRRFRAPQGYSSILSDSNSFGSYLSRLKLKPIGTKVKYYNRTTKPNYNVYCAVVDMDIDPQDLQQCADAVMRLRGEYLYQHKRYDEIKFNFLSDGKPRYFVDYAKGDLSYTKFRKYMKYVFAYANTRSLHAELTPRDIKDMQIGDVFIQKGNPYGHAVIVVNMAQDKEGNKLYMLAQSYMPAQETQILINPTDPSLSPWYRLKEGDIQTPEWLFNSGDLRSFHTK